MYMVWSGGVSRTADPLGKIVSICYLTGLGNKVGSVACQSQVCPSLEVIYVSRSLEHGVGLLFDFFIRLWLRNCSQSLYRYMYLKLPQSSYKHVEKRGCQKFLR